MKRSAVRSLMLQDAERSGLTPEDIAALEWEPLLPSEVAALCGRRVPAYRLPYFDATGKRTEHFRLRFLKKVKDRKGRVVRYWQPKGSGVHVYFPHGYAEADPTLPLYICEGEKKAALLSKLGYRALALGGVRMFSTKGDPGLVSELRTIAKGEIRIAFDGNTATNPDVARARTELAARLLRQGARVLFVDIPEGKNLDDWLVSNGKEAFDELPARPVDIREQLAALRLSDLPARVRNEQISALVLGDMQGRGAFFRTADGLLYFDREGRKPIDIGDSTAVALRCYLNDRYGINASEREFSFVYEDLRTLAVRNGVVSDPRYFSHYRRATSTLYLAASETSVYRVTPKGHSLLPNGTDDVVLRVPDGMEPIEPAQDARDRKAMDSLLSVPHIVDGEYATAKQMRLLWELWLWGVIFGVDALPTRPIVLIHGEKGAAKTTGGRASLRTLMGAGVDVFTFAPNKLDGFDAAMSSQHLLVADNVDGRYRGLEDRLATAATGGKLSLRKLYTTNEQIKIPVRSFVIVTSREPRSFTRDDVVDRLLYLRVARRKQFLDETTLMREVLRLRPAFWRYVLDTIPALLRALKKQKSPASAFRMADFAAFALCIGPVLGYKKRDVQAALEAGEKEKLAFLAEQSDLPNALADLAGTMRRLGNKDFFKDSHTPSDLLRHLETHPSFRNTTPVALGQQMVRDWEAIRLRVRAHRIRDTHAKAWRYGFEVPK